MTSPRPMTLEEFASHLDAIRARKAWADAARLIAHGRERPPAR